MIRRFLSRLFVGRYGFDNLSYALIGLGFILSVILSILHLPLAGLIYSNKAVYILFRVLNLITYIPYIIAFYRAFSKDFDNHHTIIAPLMSTQYKSLTDNGFLCMIVEIKKLSQGNLL